MAKDSVESNYVGSAVETVFGFARKIFSVFRTLFGKWQPVWIRSNMLVKKIYVALHIGNENVTDLRMTSEG